MEEGKSASAVPDNDSDDAKGRVAKRQRICKDEIIGLEFPDGRVCWCPRSTLTGASGSYFAARFGTDGNLSAGAERPGEHGRTIYFVSGDGEIFEKYILPFLFRNYPGRLPPFSKDPELWRALRREAQFYALDDLYDILYVTHTCKPNPDGRGTLYWVGTDKGQREEYRNPHSSGAVHVGGWVDNMSNSQRTASLATYPNLVLPLMADSEISRNALVQHRPPVAGLEFQHILYPANQCYNLWCGHSFHRLPTVLDLKTISVRLTHYSLRYDECGMTHWNLEGSTDGSEWEVLHAARNDPHLLEPDQDDVDRLRNTVTGAISEESVPDMKAADVLLSSAEREHRHTWTIDPPTTSFFCFFRLIGIGEEHEGSQCLHAVGLELYGDVHED